VETKKVEKLRKLQESKITDSSLFGKLVITLSFPMRQYFCCRKLITHHLFLENSSPTDFVE
jgi:hypothetical protein